MSVEPRTVQGPDGPVQVGGATEAERDARVDEILAAADRRRRLIEYVQRLRNNAGVFKDVGWDWLDRFSGIPIVGSPNAGIEWGPLSQANKAEALRVGLSYSLLAGIRLSDAVLVIIDVLEAILEAVDIDPPIDR